MSRGIHDLLEGRMKDGIYGSMDIIEAHISFPGFVETQSSQYEKIILEFAKEIEKMMHIWPAPTMNPFLDKLEKYNSDVGLECLKLFIKDNMIVKSRDKVDNYRDVVKIQVPFDILIVNVIPILENENLTIEKGTIQTLFYRHELEGGE
jgi:hypothetical protein